MTNQGISLATDGPAARGPGQRLTLLAGIAFYVALFQWMYVHYLYPFWGYFGFDYNPPGNGSLVLACVLAIAPALWMPLHLKRPSHLAYWTLYLTVFIPSIFVPLFAAINSADEIRSLLLVLFAGFALTGGGYLLPLIRFRSVRLPRSFFWKAFVCLAAAMTLSMMVLFRHHLHLVSFEDVYDLRDAANEVAEGGVAVFLCMSLAGAINPFLMGCGLFHKRASLFFAGAIGQLVVYAVQGTKGSILSILFLSAFALLFRLRALPFALKVTSAALALLGLACLSYLASDSDPGPLHALVLFVVLMRTLSLNGLMTAWYYNFFLQNPLTHFSHAKVINWIHPYPYQFPIGQEIGLAYAGTARLDATAHFWATDGLGGFGLPGILLVSFLCAAVFWILDSASQEHDPRLAALVTAYAAYNIANISLFTSLWSGGLSLLVFLLYLMPPQDASARQSVLTPSNWISSPLPRKT